MGIYKKSFNTRLNEIETSLIYNIIDIMNETIQFLKNIYFNLLNMIDSIDFIK
tara:strand:+ start:90 stop:248 length:159 start_codon:yes stop_codon:yes gene_type:complete